MTRSLLATAALLTTLALSACGSDPESGSPPPAASGAPNVPAAQEPSGSWDLAADQSASAAKAGLPMLGQEMLTVHYHSHIDLLVRGERVFVPAMVGIDTIAQKISPLHTHDATGIVHIESAEDIPFTLGQFFAEWGQPLDAKRIGPVVVEQGERLRIYRDGKEVSGDPAAIKFTKHGEFFIWIGPAGTEPGKVVSSYTFPKGL